MTHRLTAQTRPVPLAAALAVATGNAEPAAAIIPASNDAVTWLILRIARDRELPAKASAPAGSRVGVRSPAPTGRHPGDGLPLGRSWDYHYHSAQVAPETFLVSESLKGGHLERESRPADLENRAASTELLGAVISLMPDAAIVADGNGYIVSVNPQAEGLFGYGPGTLVGIPIEILVPERSRPRPPPAPFRLPGGPREATDGRWT